LNIWDIVLLQPMINILIALSHFVLNNFGITIILLTLIIRFALLPLTLKQLRATKKMQDLQPKIAELQKKYAKDKQLLAQEQMKLMKESGVSATGCAVPMLIQFPIWIALYQAIILTLAAHPESLLNLSRYLYNWALPLAILPLNNAFLGMNLANPNTIMAILVGVSMWAQQKMVTNTEGQDPKVAQQSQIMLYMMPIMFTFFSLSFPSGLSLYWLISNIFSVVVQYFVTGWGGLSLKKLRPSPAKDAGKDKSIQKRIYVEESRKKDNSSLSVNRKEGTNDGRSADIGQDGRRSDSKSSNPFKRWIGRD
jgi:YidC/Oxa1 family membrane protein insertase